MAKRPIGSRARIILAGGGSFPPSDRFRHRARNAGRSMDSLIDEFERLRRANVDLRSSHLTAAQLAMTGAHATFGSVTVRQLLATWVVYDLGHIAQISRVLAKQLRDDAGPWVEFLPVLTDHAQGRGRGPTPQRNARRREGLGPLGRVSPRPRSRCLGGGVLVA
jgi:hypothetical protein